MRDEDDEDEIPETGAADDADKLHSRRAMLRLGALGTAAVVTIRPGMAQGAISSALTCSITLPLTADAGKWVKKDGSVVKANTASSWAFPSSPLKGEDVKNAIKYSTNIPGTVADQTTGYLNYMHSKLTSGKPGFTCYASLQSPARY